jgi:hypothetical protein
MPFTSTSPPPSKRPRRIDRDQLVHDVVLGLMSGLPLAVVARRHGVSAATVGLWQARDPALAEEIAAARALGWDTLAVECLEIADDRSLDVMHDTDGTARPNMANVQSRKLAIETRLRLLACWDAGRYGPSKTLKVEGEVQVTQRHVIDPRSLDDAGRAALRALLAHAERQGLIAGPEPQDAEYDEVDDEAEAEGDCT